MDAITRISCFFPTNTLTVFVIVSNVIINDVGHCQDQQRQLMIALLIIFCILNFMSCFTDTYTASNGQKYWVFIMPFYGPLCFSLPTDQDKDRVYEFFYLKVGQGACAPEPPCAALASLHLCVCGWIHLLKAFVFAICCSPSHPAACRSVTTFMRLRQ